MKKTIAFLLAFMMLGGVLFIGVNAEETSLSQALQEGAECTCGGTYGEWTAYATEIRQIRYNRKCDGCGAVQSAKDIEPMTLSYSVPAIGANVGDTVMLSLYSVYYSTSAVMSADSIVWSSDDIDIVNGCVCPTTAGVYKLTATAGSNSKTVYLVAKNVTDTEYVLFFDDFDGEELDEGYRALEIPTGTEYYVSDGKLIMDATGNDNNHMRILLPSWVGDFGNYKIDTAFTILSTNKNNNTYWFAVMARVQKGDYPFWQAAIRQNATASSGVEIAKRTKASGVSNGWSVTSKGKFTEAISPSKYYTQTFLLDGKNATHSINGQSILTYGSVDYSVGDVGFHTRASSISIDSIKIVVPIADSTHSFSNWETVTESSCTKDGLERRECEICGEVEERTIEAGHTIVSHALKMPTCTESGWQAYETCSACDYTTFGGEISSLCHYFDREFHSVAHRGYSTSAPENTLPAYVLAKEMGYFYAECDVVFTKDGVPVLLHDSTIDRTSNGSGKVKELTYAELLEYDFGSWKNQKYAGTKIPTFEEFIALCKELGMHPYIELKDGEDFTQERVNMLVQIVEKYGMIDNCTWISFNANFLKYVKNADNTARLGYVSSALTQTVINTAKGLRLETNEVFLDISYTVINESNVLLAAANGFAIETWTVDSEANLKKLPMYISGITSNVLLAEKYFLTSTVTEPSCNEQGYTTYTCVCGETSERDFVPATEEHIAENGICTACGTAIYCANPDHNLEILGISYPMGFDKVGVKLVKCLDCDASETEARAPALFIHKGYSMSESDKNSVALGFTVDERALEEYERVTGITIRYGVFVVAQSKIGANDIFDESGKAVNGVLYADVTECKYAEIYMKVVNFADNQKDLPFAVGAYVKATEGGQTKYSYVQEAAPKENEKYSFASYNDIVNLSKN